MPMKSSIAVIAALALMLLPAAVFAQSSPPAAADPSQLSLELAQKWTDAYETGDAKALAAVYAEDATLSFAGSDPGTGRAAIEKLWAEDIAQESSSITSLSVKTETIAEGSRRLEGDYLVIERETGIVIATGAFAQTWEVQADGETWLIVLDDWQGAKVPLIRIPADAASAPPASPTA